MPAPYATLLIEKEGPIDWVTLNRPEALNTLNGQMVDDLLDYFGGLYFDRKTRIVVLRGAGRAFCAGLDIKESMEARPDDNAPRGPAAGLLSQRRISEIVMRMRRCQQPIISLVQGPACGGGFALALASDIRIAGESARMNAAFIRIGLSACDIGVSYFLPRLVGISTALEWCYSGRIFTGQEACDRGLVRSVHTAEDLLPAARAIARDIIDNTAPVSVSLTRQMMWRMLGADHPMEAHKIDSRAIQERGKAADSKEGVSSFLEKRQPSYPNRVSTDMPGFFPWWSERPFA
jgi:enoyl-CoA hydratase